MDGAGQGSGAVWTAAALSTVRSLTGAACCDFVQPGYQGGRGDAVTADVELGGRAGWVGLAPPPVRPAGRAGGEALAVVVEGEVAARALWVTPSI